MSQRKNIVSTDELQVGYRYELVEPTGKHFHPDFKPMLTPKEMLEAGVFGGAYFSEAALKEFPKSWWQKADLSPDKMQHKELNFFKVNASQTREEWQKKGWIHKDDPRGWVQWYFRYYLGRRVLEEDERQIKRWKAFRRHAAAVKNACKARDYACRPRQRQALLHWAYDSRKM